MGTKSQKTATAAYKARWRFLFRSSDLLLCCFIAFSLQCFSAAALETNSTPTGTNTSYVLSINDLVEIKVYKEDDLTARTRIDQDGTISLHLINSVAVSGRTISEARELIRSMYEKDYLVSANVTLTLIESSRTNKSEAKPKHKITISGEVKKPGVIELPEGEKIDIVSAIGLAGDFTKIANKRNVIVRRNEKGEQRKFEIDVQAMMRDIKVKPFEIRSGDFIEVRESIF